MDRKYVGPVVAVGLIIIVIVVVLSTLSSKPGTRSSGSPDDADYCNAILDPAVMAQLEVDVATRIQLAHKGAGLLGALQADPRLGLPGGTADEVGTKIVDGYGREARDLLPDHARRLFQHKFSTGSYVRVGFWTEADRKGQFIVTFGIYDAEKNRTTPKSLSKVKQTLENAYRWIADEFEAEQLLEHEDPIVRQAAERWLENADGPDVATWDVDEDYGFDRADEMRRDAKRRSKEFDRRFEETRQRIARDREEIRRRVREHQEQVRRKLEGD